MATKKRIVVPKRGEVYLVNFDSTIGSEIQKTRPALILQNDIGNEHSAVTIVSAITSAGEGKVYPTQVAVHPREGGLLNPSLALLNQIRTVDKHRLGKRLGVLTPATMRKVDVALSLSVGLLDVS
jgi:mRNA interferase MazF